MSPMSNLNYGFLGYAEIISGLSPDYVAMENLSLGFDNLKISAFSKFSRLSGDVHNVTIGPNSALKETREESPAEEEKKKVVFAIDPVETPHAVPLPRILKEFDAERREKVEEIIHERYRKYEDFTKTSAQRNEWLHNQRAFIQSVRENEEEIIRTMNQSDVNKKVNNDELIKHYQELIESKIRLKQELEKNKEKHKLRNEQFESIKKCYDTFTSVYHETLSSIKATSSKINWKTTLGDAFGVLLKTLPDSFDKITVDCKTGKVDELLVKKAMSILNETKQFKSQIEEIIKKTNAKEEEQIRIQTQPDPKPAQENVQTVVKRVETGKNLVSATNLRRYIETKQFLMQHSDLFKELVADGQMKQFRNECKQVINLTTCAISPVNPQHLIDKYMKLHDLLAGKTVIVGDKQINAARHPQGVNFCMDLLAKQFVLQGDWMISSKPEAAFCYASVIISLWNDFPTFGKLLLGHFYTECPYLVPFYMKPTPQQTMQDYYVSLGYRCVDGQIENQDKFLKRMTGMFRLYFAIFIAKPKRGHSVHPHDMRNAWNYLTSLLRLEPLDITALALHSFLKTIGFEMETVYGHMFRKLVRIITETFVPAFKQIESGGPVSRLEVLLQNYKKDGVFSKPDGILPDNFW